jgi:hypothetical protein
MQINWGSYPVPYRLGPMNPYKLPMSHTVKKEKNILLLNKEIQKGSVAKSSMRKGFLIFFNSAP